MYKLPKGEVLLIIVLFSLIFVVFGGFMNTLVLLKNDCKMPVKVSQNHITERHISFQDPSEVKYPELADKYAFPFFKWNIHFSIGDIIIVFFVITSFIFITLWHYDVRRRIKIWKNRKLMIK